MKTSTVWGIKMVKVDATTIFLVTLIKWAVAVMAQ